MTISQKIDEVELLCTNCNTTRLITDSEIGEIVCFSCGCVVSEHAEERRTERRNSDANTVRTGPGLSPRLHDYGLTTMINSKNKDSVGKSLSANASKTFGRLRKWNNRTQTHGGSGQSLKTALQEMDKIQSKLGLSNAVMERTSLFYRQASERKLVRGRSVRGMAAACLYASCKDLGHARTLTEIANHAGVSRKDIAKGYRILFRELGFLVSISDPITSVNKIASKVNASEKTKRKAISILNAAHKADIVAGKNPEIMAAAAIYSACVITGEKKSQQSIAFAANASSVSMRSRILEFREKLGLFSEEDILSKSE